MAFSFKHVNDAKKINKAKHIREEINTYVKHIVTSASKELKKQKIKLNIKNEEHITLINIIGNDYLSNLCRRQTTEAITLLLNSSSHLDSREEMIQNGDFSFAHDDSAEPTFKALNKFCLYSTWHISNVFRYLTVVNALLNDAGKKGKKEINVVDVGCSSGTFLKFWYDNCQRAGKQKINYTGIEVRAEAIKKAFDSWSKDNVKFIHTDVIKTPIKKIIKEKQDAILLLEVIEHVGQDNAKKILKDCYNALDSGGLICISSPNPQKKDGQQFVWVDNHVYEFSLEEIKEEITSAGFEVEHVSGWLCDLVEMKRKLNPEQKALLNSLRSLGTAMAGSIMANLVPEHAMHYTIIARKK